MPAYLIRHPGKAAEDTLIENPDLTLSFSNGWALIRDGHGICYAIPADSGATIQRVDDIEKPVPTKE